MGDFYSNIQLKSNLERDKFLDAFITKLSDIYERCRKEDADISYRFCFSDKWVTFTRPEYRENPDILDRDAEMFSQIFKTNAFTITVVDSDFALISLYDNGIQTDNAVVGDGEGYGVEPNPPQASLWQPLLNTGIPFEQLSNVWSSSEVFCEDALGKSADLFGIEKDNIFADYQYLEYNNSENSVQLCFRKKSSESTHIKISPQPTVSAVFNEIFGEALIPLGFQSVKDDTEDTFVKVIDKELMQVIKCYKRGTKNRHISIGARLITVYEVPNKVKQHGYFCPTPYISTIYSSRRPERYDDDFYRKISEIVYDPKDSRDIYRAVKEALEYTMQVVIPHFRRVTDLTSYLLVNREIYPSNAIIGFLQNCSEKKYLENESHEELLYVKNNYEGDFLEFLKDEKEYTEALAAVKARNFTPLTCPIDYCDLDKDYSEYYKETTEIAKRLRKMLDEIIADKELCKLIDDELERRRGINSQTLAKMGIIL